MGFISGDKNINSFLSSRGIPIKAFFENPFQRSNHGCAIELKASDIAIEKLEIRKEKLETKLDHVLAKKYDWYETTYAEDGFTEVFVKRPLVMKTIRNVTRVVQRSFLNPAGVLSLGFTFMAIAVFLLAGLLFNVVISVASVIPAFSAIGVSLLAVEGIVETYSLPVLIILTTAFVSSIVFNVGAGTGKWVDQNILEKMENLHRNHIVKSVEKKEAKLFKELANVNSALAEKFSASTVKM